MNPRSVLAAVLAAGLLLAALPVTATAGTAACDGAQDFDGDGQADAVVGDPLAGAGGTRGAGAVHIVPIGDAGKGTVLTSPDPRAGDAFGWSVRTALLDDDPCLDVVVGAPYAAVDGEAGAGAAYVFYGGAAPRRDPVRLTAPTPERDAHFGWSLAAGRLPGEPAAVVVGAPYEDADATTDSGAVYVYGARDLTDARPITQESEGVVGNGEEGDLYGWSLALGRLGGTPGDLDLAIGTPYENNDGAGKQTGNTGKDNSGAVEVLFDVTDPGELSAVKWTLSEAARGLPENAGDRFGHALAYAEFKGDPYLAVSAPLADTGGRDSGVVQLFGLNSKGELAPARTLRPGVGGLRGDSPAAGSAFGWSLTMLAASGDLSLAVGSPFESRGGTETGVVRRIPLTGDGTAGMITAPGAVPYDHFGWSLATSGSADPLSAGDVLLAGSPDQSAGKGALTLLRPGSPPRVVAPGLNGLPAAPGTALADFGASLG
ncbi:hypothetical protein [Sphaerisporangium aureirubrum]|uniref:Integrin-like protein n=1 Tax=Sphaerisporangium aureirubrum TaxID=1544736 RepID=A0ABW1NTY7_9ACTN